jgi:hypothetical protein
MRPRVGGLRISPVPFRLWSKRGQPSKVGARRSEIEGTAVRRVFLMSLLLAVGFRLSGPGWADTDDEAAIRSFGLFGAWAVDCSRPHSADNPHLAYRPGQPYPQRLLRMGRREEVFDMRHVHAIGANRLAYNDRRLGARSDAGYDVVIERVGNRVRSVSSIAAADGTALIRDGKLVHSGEPTLLFERCSSEVSQRTAGTPSS